jgi:hypothetical protein
LTKEIIEKPAKRRLFLWLLILRVAKYSYQKLFLGTGYLYYEWIKKFDRKTNQFPGQ